MDFIQVPSRTERYTSLGVQLLRDLRTVFGDAEVLSTDHILNALHAMDESPWGDLRGKPMDSRGLAARLRAYGVRPDSVRIGGKTPKGYKAADLHDAWARYLGPPPYGSATSATAATAEHGRPEFVADVADVAASWGDADAYRRTRDGE